MNLKIQTQRQELWVAAILAAAESRAWTNGKGKKLTRASEFATVADEFVREFDERFVKEEGK